jgi:hypothetical protein
MATPFEHRSAFGFGGQLPMNPADDLLHPVQVEILRRMSMAERLRISQELSRTTGNRALSAFARRYPECNQRQVLKKFVAFHDGQELADQVYPED